MKIKEGYTYTVSDSYFKNHQDKCLCTNHASDQWQKGGRPYFVAFQDRQDSQIFWAVPLSSNVSKYQAIMAKKLERFHFCDTLHIGQFGNRASVWLIQNMCPIDERCIKDLCATQKGIPLMPDRRSAKVITAMAKQAQIHHAQHPFLSVDIQKIYQGLRREHRALEAQKTIKENNPRTTKERLADAQQRAKQRNEKLSNGKKNCHDRTSR